ncbi:hypothetical protein, partial [Aeromonas media]|uniref:hypothetical protein n=1 Tax=Aeromonas media TaxID=651 RepID=UPI003D25A2FA
LMSFNRYNQMFPSDFYSTLHQANTMCYSLHPNLGNNNPFSVSKIAVILAVFFKSEGVITLV